MKVKIFEFYGESAFTNAEKFCNYASELGIGPNQIDVTEDHQELDNVGVFVAVYTTMANIIALLHCDNIIDC